MLRSIKHLQQCSVIAADGEIGHAEDFYFDDERWTIRYLMVEDDQRRPYRRVLIPPTSIDDIDWSTRQIILSITRDELDRAEPPDDSYLRSTYQLIRSRVFATDGELGHIDDLLVDDVNWAIRHVVVDTSIWWIGRKVLIDPQSITGERQVDSSVSVDDSRQSIKSAPPYDPEARPERTPQAGQTVFP